MFTLRVDGNDRVRMALYPGTGDGGDLPPNRLYYLACEGGCLQPANWAALDLGLPNYRGEGGVDLTFDSQNRPRIAFDIIHHQFGGDCTSGSDARFARLAVFDQP